MSSYSLKYFLLKVKARCNINCTYCYEYNLADQSWRDKPGTMSFDVVTQTAKQIALYAVRHNLKEIYVAYHGGEPLLLPIEWYERTHRIFKSLLPSDIKVSFGLQTNGILLSNEYLQMFARLKILVGISLDGTKEANDRFRVDFKGKSTFQPTMKGISLLNQQQYQEINGGILSVIDPRNNAVETFEFLTSLGPRSIDFLYPHYNHSTLPPFQKGDIGNWLTELFDIWWNRDSEVKIRTFEDTIHLMLGGTYSVEHLGLAPVELIVVQTDGAYEAVDSLKSTFEGAVFTGKTVFENDFDEVLSHELIKTRLDKHETLCDICKKCEFVKICGGDYIPHRYSHLNQFDNPSVYCTDLKIFFNHVKKALLEELPEMEELINQVTTADINV